MRVEARLDGSLAVRFGERYLPANRIDSPPAPAAKAKQKAVKATPQKATTKSKWMAGFFEKPGPSLKKAILISNATS